MDSVQEAFKAAHHWHNPAKMKGCRACEANRVYALAVHIKACVALGPMTCDVKRLAAGVTNPEIAVERSLRCGDGWLCDDAPKEHHG